MGTLDSDSRAALEALVSSIPQVSHMNAASSIKEMLSHAYRDGSIQSASRSPREARQEDPLRLHRCLREPQRPGSGQMLMMMPSKP